LKITFIEIEAAFNRAVWGESVRTIARDLGVTEGCLRFHFRKGPSPKDVRRLGIKLGQAQQALTNLTAAEQKAVNRLVAKAMAAT